MTSKIRNLELELVEEKTFGVFSKKDPIKRLGNLTVRTYESKIGLLTTEELSNEYDINKEYLVKNITLGKKELIQERFYGEKISLIKYFDEKQSKKINDLIENIN